MDKEYLIHNIDYKDNPEDQHLTLDIAISDLELDAPDITATIGIDTFVNGMPTRSNKYEDVSLTGAGGGGEILPIENCTITFTNIRTEGDPLPYEVIGCEITFNLQAAVYYFTGATANYSVENGTYNDSKVEIMIPTNHDESTAITGMTFFTDNGDYFWDNTGSPVISGDATYDSDAGAVHITGNCTLSPDTFLD